MKYLKSKSLGNHEFDEAVSGLIPFLRNVTVPVLAANLILDKEPELKQENNLLKSIIITKNNVKVGIIGYLTPDTEFLAPKNNVKYEDEVTAIRKEIVKLKSKGVNIFIALGHSGFTKDLEIAREVDDIDLVIGGHTNTFLWNDAKFTEKPEQPQGPYPTIVIQNSGRKVPVVQAYAYTKYLGRLHLQFNALGEIDNVNGEPILLNQNIIEDPELLELIAKYRNNVNIITNEVVGISNVMLDGDCRLDECNLGSFITDSILYYTKEVYSNDYDDVNIAIIQGGRIRSSIDRDQKPFKLTRGDWITVLPFGDNLSIVTMNGSILLQALEHSIAKWSTLDKAGQFLQVSGIVVHYDLAKPPGSRIVQAKAVCSNCDDNNLSPIDNNYEYKVMMPIFLADGGDGYAIFKDLPRQILPFDEVACILSYLSKFSPISPQKSSRISIINKDEVVKSDNNAINQESFVKSDSNTNISAKLKYKTSLILSIIFFLRTFTYLL